MSVREIVGPSNPILRKKALRVTSFDRKFQQLVDDMVETMLDAPGAGLAAPQVAVSQRVIVVQVPYDEESQQEYGKDVGKIHIIANPEIVKASKNIVGGVEACLSIPGYWGVVDRHEDVVVKGLDRHGKPFRIKAKGWLARIFQHEIDHLEGRLFIDIARKIWEEPPDDEEGEDTPEKVEQAGQIRD